MTVADLMQLLEEHDPAAEVRLLSQPSWPFEYDLQPALWTPATPDAAVAVCYICGAYLTLRNDEWHHDSATLDADHEPEVDDDYEAPDWQPTNPPAGGVVYLVEGTQLGYGTRAAWEG